MDGFVLTHAVEPIDVPAQADIDAFLPRYAPRQSLDPDDPVTIGAMVGPDAFMEVRYLMHAKQQLALDAIPRIAADFADTFGRESGGLVRPYRLDDAELAVVALGSVTGTVEDAVDALRAKGIPAGALSLRCFRPLPLEAVRAELAGIRSVVVLEKAFSAGSGGIVSRDVRLALDGLGTRVCDVIAGLGGRPITAASLTHVLWSARIDALPQLTFMDLHEDVVHRELSRLKGAVR
jgi:pyruvate ferredoxin oxidoreductase alpha subunit